MRPFLVSLVLTLFSVVASAAGAVAPEALSKAVAERVSKVAEFEFIRAEAKKMGVRVYLFGGTAAGFAHYVKWDLEREAGDDRFQKDRFDYDYTNIYRTNQDLDIVIDGTSAQADHLESAIRHRFDYVQGKRSKWEIRLLRGERNGKIALLNNPDFLNQHTDSNSTGMVDLTASGTETSIRDLRDWDSPKSKFLLDVAAGEIHYYDSDSHATTSYFKLGENPPIFSVLRFLTKVFQYELELRPEDEAIIRRRISEFDVNRDLKTARAKAIFNRLGAKMLQNPVNMGYAFETIDRLGLREKLNQGVSDSGEQSLRWWLKKKALDSKSVGRGNGKTARELGIDVVAHETVSYTAWESITLAPTGQPNVLESRVNHEELNEYAVWGDGFYTKRGRIGARGTNLTVRFHVDPNAREGTDFILGGHQKEFVIMKNTNAFTIIPEGLNLGYVDFLEIQAREAIDGRSDSSDRAIREKLQRRMAKFKTTDILTREEIAHLDESMANGGSIRKAIKQSVWFGRDFFSLPLSTRYRDAFRAYMKMEHEPVARDDSHIVRVVEILSKPQWIKDKKLVESFYDWCGKRWSNYDTPAWGIEIAARDWLKVVSAADEHSIENVKRALGSFYGEQSWASVFEGSALEDLARILKTKDEDFRRRVVAEVHERLPFEAETSDVEVDRLLKEELVDALGLSKDLGIFEARLKAKYLTDQLVEWAGEFSLERRRELLIRVADLDPNSLATASDGFVHALKDLIDEDPKWLEFSLGFVRRPNSWSVFGYLTHDKSYQRNVIELTHALIKTGDPRDLEIAMTFQLGWGVSERRGTAFAFLRDVDKYAKRPLSNDALEKFSDIAEGLIPLYTDYASGDFTKRELKEVGEILMRFDDPRFLDQIWRIAAKVFDRSNFDFMDRVFAQTERVKAAGRLDMRGRWLENAIWCLRLGEFEGKPEWLERYARIVGPRHSTVSHLMDVYPWLGDEKLERFAKHPLMPWKATRFGLARSISKGRTLAPPTCESMFKRAN